MSIEYKFITDKTDEQKIFEDICYTVAKYGTLNTVKKLNLNDIDLTSQLLTEIYAPIWQRGSEVKIIDDCISDANIILALVQRCSNAGDIRVRLRNEEIPMEFDVEW